jgi:hypothetical protein
LKVLEILIILYKIKSIKMKLDEAENTCKPEEHLQPIGVSTEQWRRFATLQQEGKPLSTDEVDG